MAAGSRRTLRRRRSGAVDAAAAGWAPYLGLAAALAGAARADGDDGDDDDDDSTGDGRLTGTVMSLRV